MANDRVIHIGTELDTSGMLAGINKMRQMVGSISVDSNLFKDINKDFDKLTKLALNMGTALKNGIPQKDINGFIKTTEEMSKIYSALPAKIRQVSVEAGNIKFSKEAITRLDEIDVEVEKLNKDIKNAFGSDLRSAIREAVPTNVISNKTLDNILKGKNAMGGFEDELVKTQSAARKTEQDLRQLITTFSSTGNPNQKAFATLLQESLNKGNVSVDTDRLIGFTSDLEGQQSKAIAAINNYNAAREKSIQLEQYYAQIMEIVNNTETTTAQKTEQVAKLVQERQEITNKTVQESLHLREEAANVAEQTSNKEVNGLKKVGESAENTNNHIQRQDSLLRQLAARATSLIGIGAMFNYITRGVRDAWNGIKDLDKEFTQIAVVTDKTTSQLWQSFGTYSQMAQRLGVATKDAVATSALYYQQGLDTADVMTLTAETIKMAQIAGMDFATATNQMTAAIRGFNLEMNQASMVNDIFSTLAAHAAVSTQELSYALTKTASIAESAGMSIDTTSAFLTKMIETTREAPKQKLAA